MIHPTYDVVVVGAGHAGNEAAASAANLGAHTLLITMNMGVIGQMSCNPAMGGIAKGQIIREIDALGGYSGIVSDESAIQFRMLNKSKGPAMWSPRTQNDRMLFANSWRMKLEQIPQLDFLQDMVNGLVITGDRVVGVTTGMGHTIHAKSVVLTAGTFLNALMHIGEKSFGGGRSGEKAATGITEQLVSLGFTSDRMKTGTPPRVDGRSLNYGIMEEQLGDADPKRFSYLDTPPLTKQRSCHITYTNTEVHELLRTGFDRSPMFNGRIQGLGPRYCPSIEDKIDRFADKDSHQLFVEPEGWNTVEVYVNGFSTSLPEEVQVRALRSVPGFENVKFFRPGYAVEYDFFHPTQLHHSLETKNIQGLYFAGQINGTTGYEEAGSQGLIAGINAARSTWNMEPLILGRDQAYIGVLIDDLVTKGTKEPYRMFTSRAEYRILLRQDNADERLTPLSHAMGLASDQRLKRYETKRDAIKKLHRTLEKTSVSPTFINDYLAENNSEPIKQKQKAHSIAARPQVDLKDLLTLLELDPLIEQQAQDVIESTSIAIKYSGYIEKEREMALKMKKLEHLVIPSGFDFQTLQSLSAESREKLTQQQPKNLGQASRISGVSQSDLAVLVVRFGR